MIRSLSLGSVILALSAGCMVGDPSLSSDDYVSFEEFKSQTYKEPWEGGAYIVNGDTPIGGDKALYEFWQSVYEPGEALIVNTVGGSDDKWSDTRKLDLTYCVSTTFGTNKQRAVDGMAAGAALWENAANVNFIYVPSEDANCTASNTNVLFDVRPVNTTQYLARAFFPSTTRSQRNVLIAPDAFNTSWPLSNILGHELGHTLGFRHEHTRPEAGTCFEDNNWRALTPYDSASIMHYPQCNGSSNDLSFTTRDGQGVSALYGAPGGQPPPPPPPPPGGEQTQSWNGSLVQNRGTIIQLSPGLSVRVGTSLRVVMTGTGDPDLYVRYNNRPTLSRYQCRPYLDGPGESCDLTVPSGATIAYVGVVGYTTATYNITATYTPAQ